MKQRLVVMNGQRIVQSAQGSTDSFENGKTEVVGKANTLKPGVYNLYSAATADKSQGYDGQILHASKDAVYQKTGANIIKHDRSDFDIVPAIASVQNIKYDEQGRAVVAASTQQLGRGHSR